jgi:hypothetical protein
LDVKSASEARAKDNARPEPSPAALFTLVWGGLSDLLGTAAAATLVRRAALRGTPGEPALAELQIARVNLEYQYTLPSAWREGRDGTAASRRALQHLVDHLLPLLADLTGPVAVRRLAQIRDLREHGIIPSQEDGA